MAPAKKRAWLSLGVLVVFLGAFLVLFQSRGAAAFRPPANGTPWITVLSALCVLALAGSLLMFQPSLRPADLLGDERERALALQAGLLAKTFLLALVFGIGIWLGGAADTEPTIEVPRRAIGFAVAALMAVYLGVRAVVLLVLYGRE